MGHHQAAWSQRGVYYDLYVILGIYSRYIVGWTVAAREDSETAKALIAAASDVHGPPGSPHAHRGTSMTTKPVAQLLVDLGVARSHSLPHVSRNQLIRYLAITGGYAGSTVITYLVVAFRHDIRARKVA